jgi:predicted XRE-type DNA-binding protein
MKLEVPMSDETPVDDSRGHVSADMGTRDADLRLAKAELARILRNTLGNRGLTQTKAARLLGVKQPDVSDLMRGKLARFSIERLVRLLNALDFEIRIQIGPRPSWKQRAGISVEEVASFS